MCRAVRRRVVSTAKVQKIWEQFTTKEKKEICQLGCFDCKSTKNLRAIHNPQFVTNSVVLLFRLQKYKKFESNSQPQSTCIRTTTSCFDCKSTKNLRAIHNGSLIAAGTQFVVSTAKVQKIWEQFTTRKHTVMKVISCFDCKSTKNLRTIHNAYG